MKRLGMGVMSLATLNCCAWAADGTTDVSDAVKSAVEAGKSVEIPDYEALQKEDAVSGYVDGETGDTSAIESLREGGQAILYEPGRSAADACWSKTDTTCLAVQVVDKASTNRPTIDPDVSGDLMAGRDEVVNNADSAVDLGGTGSSTGTCRPNTSVVTKPEETMTCDVRVTTSGGTSTEETCQSRWESIIEEVSKWACQITWRESFQTTCSVPVVVEQKTTTTLACFEGKRDADKETCPVIVNAAKEERHYAACVTPKYKSVTKNCTEKLVVKPEASCTVNTVTKASNTDYGVLAEDAVQGADTLEVRYTCTPEFALTVGTNSKTLGEIDITKSVGTESFSVVSDVTGGSVRFDGEVVCTGTENCVATVTMIVWEDSDKDHVLQGSVTTRLVFVKYVKKAETEYRTVTCTGI